MPPELQINAQFNTNVVGLRPLSVVVQQALAFEDEVNQSKPLLPIVFFLSTFLTQKNLLSLLERKNTCDISNFKILTFLLHLLKMLLLFLMSRVFIMNNAFPMPKLKKSTSPYSPSNPLITQRFTN